MGHKVNPTGFRLGVIKGWQSRWYAERDYKDILAEDMMVRKLINKELFNASVSRIEIERAAANQVSITIHTARPGIVIGKSGEKVDKLRTLLEAKTKKRVRLNILEIRQPELDAYLVGRSVAEQLEKRVSFRRAMKQAVQKSMRANAKGIRIVCGGRLGGAEIARSEKEVEGKIPLHTLRADIDYGLAEAHTTFGVIGIKVWIYKGDILPDKRREAVMGQLAAPQPAFAPREGGDRRDRRRSGEGGYRGDRNERGDRGQRPQGDRSQGQGGERGGGSPRGERPARPQGERPARPQGDRPQSGDRGQRPQGDRPQSGERPPRQPRPPRPQGERPARTQPPQEPQEPQATQPTQPAQTSIEQAPFVPTTPEVSTPVVTPEQPTTPDTDTGTTQSE